MRLAQAVRVGAWVLMGLNLLMAGARSPCSTAWRRPSR